MPIERKTRLGLLGLALLVATPALAEDLPRALLAPVEEAVGSQAVHTERHPEYMRMYFSGVDGRIGVEVTYRKGPSEWASLHYQVQPAPDSPAPEPLLRRVLAILRELERQPGHRPMVANHTVWPRGSDPVPGPGKPAPQTVSQDLSRSIAWYPTRSITPSSWFFRLTREPTPGLQLLLLLALGLVALRARAIWTRLRRIPTGSWIWLGAVTGIGLALRLAFGAHVPGFISGHGLAGGFVSLREVLIQSPEGANVHGNAYEALYGLVTALLPNTEMSVLAVQVLLSTLCIPLIFALARAWIGRDGPALWSAAALALMPVAIYFAASEVRPGGGTFFALLSLVVLEQGVRDGRATSLLSAALLTVFAMQFHPVLFALPTAGVILILVRKQARALLSRPQAWLASAGFLATIGLFLAFQLRNWSWTPDSLFGTGFFVNPPSPLYLFVPDTGLDLFDSSNAFLHVALTPPIWVALALCGLWAAVKRRSMIVLAILAVALLWTWPGMFLGRLNLGRLQLPALALWAILIGHGAHEATALIGQARRPFRRMAMPLVAVLLVGGLIVWPGPLFTRPTPVAERALTIRALPQLRAGCAVLSAPEEGGANWTLPAYLDQQAQGRLRWGSFTGEPVPDTLLDALDCVYYYRLGYCYTLRPEESRNDPLRPVCRAIEDQLVLQAEQVEQVVAVPDGGIDYSREELELGFFRITGLRERPRGAR